MSDASPDIQRLIARLRFRHLRLLVELQAAGSLRAAAEALNLTQPALSKALVEIEAAFGVELFVRSPRGLKASERGAVAIRGATALLGELARVALETSSTPPLAVIRLGAPPFVAQGHLPELLLGARQRGLQVRLTLVEERVPRLVALLLDGRLDALVSSHPLSPISARERALRHEWLFDSDFVVIGSCDHPLARKRRVSWIQLAAQDWVMPDQDSLLRRMLEDAFRQAGVGVPVPIVESTSPVTNYRLVAKGLGIGAVPGAIFRALEADRRVRPLRVAPAVLPNSVALIHRDDVDPARLALVRQLLGLAPLADPADG